MLNFPLMQNFVLGSMHTGLQRAAAKNAKVDLLETSLKYYEIEQVSYTRFLSQSQGTAYLFASNLDPSTFFPYKRQKFLLKISLGTRLRVREFLSQKILLFQPFPCNFPDLRLKILGN